MPDGAVTLRVTWCGQITPRATVQVTARLLRLRRAKHPPDTDKHWFTGHVFLTWNWGIPG